MRPETLPGRPGTFPNRPGGSGRPDRPGIGNRPNLPGDGSGIGDRPGIGNRPNLPGDRPGIGNRPGRPGNRPNFGDRDRWTNNGIINNRPGWVNIDNSTNINIRNRWNNALVRPSRPGWGRPAGDRLGYWNGWGNGVRDHWYHHHHHHGYFGNDWWVHHYHGLGGWHYHYHAHNYPASYWWTIPTFAACTSWFSWSAPAAVWSEPVYYDYGTGGNVVYQDNSVYIGGTEVATAEEFAMSAMELATVPPPESDEQAAEAEWMPLGTFAVSADQQDVEPSRVIQLALSKEGIISGTLYNTQTDQAQSVQGQVDKETQRVAFRVGESDDIVVESGLYNLTQEEAPVLVHFGADKAESWLLVRLEEPENQEDGT